jgi:two-component system sensor histidine kinase KdpD
MEKERELLRSALLTSVSHDLRTPLSSMIGSASSLIELGGTLSEAQKTELLRLGYGGLRLERDWIGLDEIVSVVIRRVKPLLNGHVINTRLAAETPLLYVHAALIEQAIYNILENAVKHSPTGSTIRLDAAVTDGQLIIDIRDKGPGIPVAERERVFDMFYTLNRRDRHSAGTGLGLAICKGMIGAHGGDVQILDNDEGMGCLFRIKLPLTEKPAALMESA